MTKKVVIVGGGFAGSTLAKILSQNKSLELTLIDNKEYFEHTPSVLRTVVAYKEEQEEGNNNVTTDKESNKITAPITVLHSTYFTGKLVVGEAVEITDKHVRVRKPSSSSGSSILSPPTSPPVALRSPIASKRVDSNTKMATPPQVKEEDDTIVEFDYLAICTGSLYPGFVKTHEAKLIDRDINLMREYKSLKSAQRILIVGGGPAAVELAGDILHHYPDKELTLVHAKPVIIDRTHPKAQYVAQQTLETYARMILHQRIVALQVNEDHISVRKSTKKSPFLLLNSNNRTYSYSMMLKNVEKECTLQFVTNEGIRDTVDKVFFCCGASSSAGFLQKNMTTQLDDEYRVKVNNFLQVEGFPHIFAAGDITHFKEEKLAERAVRQAEVVAENIARLCKGQPVKVQYFPQSKPGAQVISVGPQQGVFMMWGSVVCCGEATHQMKTTFLSHHVKRLLTPPSENPKAKNPHGSSLRPKIAVLGQGGLSVEVVRYLAHRGITCSVIVPNNVPTLPFKDSDIKNHTQIVQWDPANPGSLTSALSGMQAVLLTCAIGETMVDECESFIKACQAATVGCIVKCTQGAIDAELRHHYLAEWNFQIENLMKSSGIPYVMLRHTHFLTTFTMFCAAHIRLYRTMVWPLGSGAVRWVDMRDVVRSVCKVLIEPTPHLHKTYNLTGAVEQTAEDICLAVSAVLAEKIHLVNCPASIALNQLTDFGIPNNLAQVLVQMHTQHTSGTVQSGDIEKIIGKKPRMFSRWLKKNLYRFTDYPPVKAPTIRVDFLEVLRDEEGSAEFLEYLVAHGGEKNFLFWKAVEEFKNKLNYEEMVDMAEDIITRFVEKESPTEVGLTQSIRQRLLNRFHENKIDLSLFEEAQLEVGFVMEDWFPSFRKFEKEKQDASAKRLLLTQMQPPRAITSRSTILDEKGRRARAASNSSNNDSGGANSSPSPPMSIARRGSESLGSGSDTAESGSDSDPERSIPSVQHLLPRKVSAKPLLSYPLKPLPPLPSRVSVRFGENGDMLEHPLPDSAQFKESISPRSRESSTPSSPVSPRYARNNELFKAINPPSPRAPLTASSSPKLTPVPPFEPSPAVPTLRTATSEPSIGPATASNVARLSVRSPLAVTASAPTQLVHHTSTMAGAPAVLVSSNTPLFTSAVMPLSPSTSPNSVTSPVLPNHLMTYPSATGTGQGNNANNNNNAPQPVTTLPVLMEVYFDPQFREAFRMHLENETQYGGAGENLAQFLSLIADITRYKSVFEESEVIKSRDAITLEKFNYLNSKPKLPLRISPKAGPSRNMFGVGGKKKSGELSISNSKKYLQDNEPKYQKAKKRAQKIVNTYLVPDSKDFVHVPQKIRDKLARNSFSPRVSQAVFNKLQAVAFAKLENEIPRFAQSLEYICFKDMSSSRKEVTRIKAKMDEVEIREQQLKIELQILELQHKNLRSLFLSKKLMELRRRPKHTFLCGFENFNSMNKLWEALPVCDLTIPPADTNVIVGELGGESGLEEEGSWREFVCGHVTSTYPPKDDGLTRQGDPICDVFRVLVTTGYTILLVADGCSWGRNACEASKNASLTFLSYTKEHLTPDIKNLRLMGQLLIQSLEAAHQAIFTASRNAHNMQFQNWDNWDVGTTTILGGVLIPLSANNEWGFVCVSVGDCKVFRYSANDNTVQDLTAGNRTNLMDARDPGGRIGPYLPRGRADLRNLMLITSPCHKGDVLFSASDGVHDNFDPQMLGIPPRKLGIEVDTWEQAEIESPSLAQKVKNEFMERTLLQTITKNGQKVTAQSVTRSLVQYCMDVTEVSRHWMLKNPNNKLPEDYSTFPGKMDHTTCVSLQVDNYVIYSKSTPTTNLGSPSKINN